MADSGTPRASLLEKALALATVLVPVAVVFIANIYSSAVSNRESNFRLTELAAGILRAPATPETRSLRAWAVQVINRYSELPIPEETGKALTDSVSLPPEVWRPAGPLRWGQVTAGSKEGTYRVLACTQDGLFCDTTWVTVPKRDSLKTRPKP